MVSSRGAEFALRDAAGLGKRGAAPLFWASIMNNAQDQRRWQQAVLIVFAITVARLIWLALDRTDLYPDEAQYWWWSLHPAFGYYSKPPMVAWLIAATTALFQSDDEFVVRLAAPLLHFAAALFIYKIGERLYGSRAGFWSAIT
ncbi:MAG TPA: glycosyltransferase family 39 protein, partial [Stellaceae bacterium]|nr:glycosyltransferase family 39 protein [Stellaceae bacterium]